MNSMQFYHIPKQILENTWEYLSISPTCTTFAPSTKIYIFLLEFFFHLTFIGFVDR